MFKETAYDTLDRVSKIKSKEERREALREELAKNNQLATIIQYAYHPLVEFDLPEGELPESIAKKSKHDEAGPLYTNVRTLYQYMKSFQMKKVKKEANFLALYEGVASNDAELLIGMKDKKLPWRTLNEKFVKSAVPELFPAEEIQD